MFKLFIEPTVYTEPVKPPNTTTAMLDALAKLDSRLVRMETRLVRLMDANGLDCDGKKRPVVE